MKRRLVTACLLALVGLLAASALTGAQTRAQGRIELELPRVALSSGTFDLGLELKGEGWPERGTVLVEAGGRRLLERTLPLEGELRFEGLRAPPRTGPVLVRVAGRSARAQLRVIPSWLAILPPVLAILLAIVLREVVLALAAGVWLGATFAAGFDPLAGLLRTADTYAVGALADRDHASIAIFSLLLGGMIGVIARSGGAQGMAEVVTRVARTRLTGALATWLMGLAIFFDDYSNSLLVGATMRPITDRLKISREKLAFLVDATAAPVSSFAVVSSWVGVEVGYIADQYAALSIEGDPYLVFLQTIPYRFYPILMLLFGLAVILLQRDFGPMRAAEVRALWDGQVSRPGADLASDFEAAELRPPEGKRARWGLAVVPILVVVASAMVGMYTTGRASLERARASAVEARDAARAALEASPGSEAASAALERQERALQRLEPGLRTIFGKASSLEALLWAALLGGVVAILLAVLSRTLSLREAMGAWVAGVRSITLAVMILVLAWSLGRVCHDLHTAELVVGAIGDRLPAGLLPAGVFLVAAAVSFATGTSWGTMGILFPLVVPLAHELSPDGSAVVLGAVGSILSGSVWGDHCSPISDTTIMSSMASSCDHVDHVRTQLPYALVVGGVSLLVGELATGLGLFGPWVALALGAAAVLAIVRFVGRPVGVAAGPASSADDG